MLAPVKWKGIKEQGHAAGRILVVARINQVPQVGGKGKGKLIEKQAEC